MFRSMTITTSSLVILKHQNDRFSGNKAPLLLSFLSHEIIFKNANEYSIIFSKIFTLNF